MSKDADGKINVKNEASSGTETGAVVGAVLGSLLFVVFPIGGIIGGAVDRRAHRPGGEARHRRHVRQGGRDDLPAGGSALFLLDQGRRHPGLLIAAMRQYDGRVRADHARRRRTRRRSSDFAQVRRRRRSLTACPERPAAAATIALP